MIEIRDLTVTLGGKTVLDGYSASFPQEGLTYLSGPSGVGKTTLLRVLAGIQAPDRGSVTLTGRSVLLFQEDRLFPRQTALKQVEAVLPRERRGEAGAWLELTELGDAAQKLPEELSGGMARRLALARCLAIEGDLYLLDEPFAGVDLERAERILARLRTLGKPVLLTGHAPELADLCDWKTELVTA